MLAHRSVQWSNPSRTRFQPRCDGGAHVPTPTASLMRVAAATAHNGSPSRVSRVHGRSELKCLLYAALIAMRVVSGEKALLVSRHWCLRPRNEERGTRNALSLCARKMHMKVFSRQAPARGEMPTFCCVDSLTARMLSSRPSLPPWSIERHAFVCGVAFQQSPRKSDP